jgi:hypothetical protein
MRTTIARRTLLTSALLLSLAAVPERGSATHPNAIFPDVTGFWSGEFASDSGETGFASLDIPAQERRRFAGTFVFHPPTPIAPPNPCAVLGTVSASGEISMVGRNDEFFLHVHGHVANDLMSLEYMRLSSDGAFEMGTATVSLETGGGT